MTRLLRPISLLTLLYAIAISLLYLQGLGSHHRAETAWFIAGFVLMGSLAAGSRWSGEPSATGGVPIRTAVSFAVCAASALVLYLPSLDVGLLSDDFVLLERASIWQLSMDTNLFRPLPMLVWSVTTTLSGSPVILHLVNVVVHGINGWLLYRVAWESGLETFAGAAAILFLAAPANVEAVTWISCLFDLLMVTGVLLCVQGCMSERTWLVAAGVAIALLSKETGIVAAPIGVMFALVGRRAIRIPLTAIAATLAFTVFRLLAFPLAADFRVVPSRHLLASMLSRAFGGLALPWSQADVVNHPWLVQFPWLFLAALLGVVSWWCVERRTLLLAAGSMVWMLLSVAPVYSFFFVADTLEGARYLYLGTAGFCLLLSTLAFDASRHVNRNVILGMVAVSTVSGIIGVEIHQRAWRSAAQRRDFVLRAAKDTIGGRGCRTVSATNLPDSEQGAYVFRNGFAQALRESGIIHDSSSNNLSCEYDWTGNGFIPR